MADFNISTNIKLLKEAVWDERTYVSTYTSLLSFTSSDYIPNGFVVACLGTDDVTKRGLWMCINKNNLSSAASWVIIGISADDKAKLDSIQGGATANQTDAYLLSRANHTGTQSPSTIVQDTNNRFVSDTEKSTWNGKQNNIGYTPENQANKTATQSNSITNYPNWAGITSYVGGLSTVYQPLEDQRLSTTNDVVHKSVATNGTAGNGFVQLNTQSVKPATPTTGTKLYADSSNRFSIITPLGFARTFYSTTLTGDRLYNFQDKSYTIADDAVVAHLAGTETFTGDKTFNTPLTVSGNNPRFNFLNTNTNNTSYLTSSSDANTFSLNHTVYKPGGQGASILFNSNNKYAQGDDTGIPVGNQPFSVSMWYKTPTSNLGGGVGSPLISWGSASGSIDFRTFTTPRMGVVVNGNQITSLSMTGFINNVYNNILISYDGNQIRLFLNNQDKSVVTIGTLATLTGGINALRINNGSLGNAATPNSNATYDEVIFYNKAINRTSGTGTSIDEVAAIYNKGNGTPSPPSAANIIRRYTFDEGSGTICNDTSGNTPARALTTVNAPPFDLNGKIATAGAAQQGVPYSFTDGSVNSELGVYSFGDLQGGTILQGRAVRWMINGKYPLLMGLNGGLLLDPSISNPDVSAVGTYSDYSILKIGAGTTTVSQIQLTDGAVVPSYSINTAGSLQRNADSILWNNGTAWVPLQQGYTARYLASGNGTSTSITIPHGLSGITTNSSLTVEAHNSASSGRSYSSIDSTNVTIVFPVAPVSGTNNLSFTFNIKP